MQGVNLHSADTSKAAQNKTEFEAKCPSLCSPVVAAAHSLAQLAAAAAAAFSRPRMATRWRLQQVDAGCAALASCILLACDAQQVSAHAAQTLGAACSLVLGPGRTVLERSMPAGRQRLPAAAASQLASICDAQVTALESMLAGVLSPECRPEAAAVLASSTAKPAALLPWLATLSMHCRLPWRTVIKASGQTVCLLCAMHA